MNYHNHFGLYKILRTSVLRYPENNISRRINKVLASIFDDAWTIIEQHEEQRLIDQSKFISAQHTSSTIINVKFDFLFTLLNSSFDTPTRLHFQFL